MTTINTIDTLARFEISHYENTHMQYTEIFSSVKIGIFARKKNDSLNIFAENIHDGYTLEPPR